MKFSISLFFFGLSTICFFSCFAQKTKKISSGKHIFEVREDYFEEPKDIPKFWINSVEDVVRFLQLKVKKGKVEKIGISAGNRPIFAVTYGSPRKGNGTTTFSGSLGYGNIDKYRGPDTDKTVYIALAGVHGGEFETIVGAINLINTIETGKDLNNKDWPEITEAFKKLDRLIIIPIANPDGRARIPIRMEKYRDTLSIVHEYINTGGNPDGTIIGWPWVKGMIPFDFKRPGFPGGYPNDNGINMMHDDFFGTPSSETRALLDLAAKEKPDLILNMHTGAAYINMLRPFAEPQLMPVFDELYKKVHTRLAIEGLMETMDVQKESFTDYRNPRPSVFNLDGALNLHCGVLSVIVESPSHGFSRFSRGKKAFYTPEMLMHGQLYCHLEAIKFLIQKGSRSKW